MMSIECFGQVGSGKSTVAQVAERTLLEAGYEPLTMRVAVDRCLARSSLGRLAGRVLPAGQGRFLRAVYTHGMRPLYSLRLALSNPALVGAVIRAQLGNGLPWWHKRKIWRLFFNQANGRAFTGHRLVQNELLLLEEGLLQRAINLFSWQMDGVRTGLASQYLAHLPTQDPVLLIDTPAELCWQRAEGRGLPRRLQTKDEATAVTFFDNAGQVAILVKEYLADSERTVIVVDNSGDFGQFEAALRAQLQRTVAAPGLSRPSPIPA